MEIMVTDDIGTKRRHPVAVSVIGALCVGFLSLLLVFYFNATLEDAHITFRYARHLAEGNGFGAWNVGEAPVEGFTSFSWTALIAGALWAGVSAFIAAKAMGALSLASIILLCLKAWQNERRSDLAQSGNFLLIAAIIFSSYLPFAWYAMSGMEAMFFVALATALLLIPRLVPAPLPRAIAGAALSALIVATRPEGILLAGCINGYHLVTDGFPRERRMIALSPWAAAILAFAAMTLFRYHHFQDVLPNTYYAKGQGGILHAKHGVFYVGLFVVFSLPLWLVAAKGLIRGSSIWGGLTRIKALAEKPVFPVFLAAFLALYTVYVIKVGGDPDSAFPMWRHFVHIAPIWVFLVAVLIERGFPTMRSQFAAAIIAVLLCDLLVVARYPRLALRDPAESIVRDGLFAEERPNPYFVWLRQFTDENTLTAAALAGQWGWYIPGRQIDVLGLNNRHIAHFGTAASNGAVDGKTDMTYVMAARPDFIDGYLSATSLLQGVCPSQMSGFRSEMLTKMVRNPIFRTEYVFLRNAPYAEIDRAIFARRSYLARWPDELANAVPVSKTSLYQGGCAGE